nr:DUF1573 domain-containing protein [uncultured Holophaga sp.]
MRSLVFLVPALVVLHGQDALVFDHVDYNFGRITTDRKVTHHFKATNKSRFPLQIKQVLPSCGCTSTVAGQWFLKPGESTDLEVAFDPRGFRGVVHKSVQVKAELSSNPPVPVSQLLTFQADIVRDVMPSTNTLFFQAVPRNTPRKATLTLASGNGQPVKVTRLEIPGAPYLSASTHANGNDAVVEVVFNGTQVPAGRNAGVETMTAQLTSPGTPYVRTRIQWDLKSRISTSPERVAWVDAAGKELSTKLVLTDLEGHAFRVTNASSTSSRIRVEGVGAAAAPKQELRVVLAPSGKAGVVNEWITLFTDEPEQPEMKIRVSAVLR